MDFMSRSAVFQLHQKDGKVIMKGCVAITAMQLRLRSERFLPQVGSNPGMLDQ